MNGNESLAIHQDNTRKLQDVDGALDIIIGQTGQMNAGARAIGKEIEEQTRIVKETNAHMDVTNDKIDKATDKLKSVQKATKSNFAAWIIMVLLVIAIIVVAVVKIPKAWTT
jgi:t-SNARE complex subunit (syntaxin)